MKRSMRRVVGRAPAHRWMVAVLLSGCVGTLLVAGAAWGEPASLGYPAGTTRSTWAPPDGGEYRFGLMQFSTLQKGGEWSLGAARDLDLGVDRGAWSYLGAGLSLTRTLGGEGDLDAAEFLDELELGAWVGGCVVCSLGGGATLDLEMRWAPDSLSVGRDPLGGERRSGLMLRIPW